jgi:UDP-glucose 4-epimerase
MIKGKNIFITGGAGFIASTLISRLIDDNRITVYDNFSRDTLSSTPYINHPNITVIRGDVLDYQHVEDSINDVDIVVHAAAIAGIDTVIRDPVKTMEINMIGTANVLRAAWRKVVRDRFLDFSTSEVFGSMALNSREDDSTVTGSAGEARWVYSVSKLAGEHLVKAYHHQYKIPTVTVRPFNVYGPGQTGEGAMQIFIKKALRNEDIHIHGDGNQIRAWCYVDDFVECMIHCLASPKAIGQTYNIGNARAVITILGLAQTVCRVLDSSSQILFKPALSADIALRVPSVNKILEDFGFRAEVDLDEGIRRTAEYFRHELGK